MVSDNKYGGSLTVKIKVAPDSDGNDLENCSVPSSASYFCHDKDNDVVRINMIEKYKEWETFERMKKVY